MILIKKIVGCGGEVEKRVNLFKRSIEFQFSCFFFCSFFRVIRINAYRAPRGVYICYCSRYICLLCSFFVFLSFLQFLYKLGEQILDSEDI